MDPGSRPLSGYRTAVAAITLGLTLFCISVGTALLGESRPHHRGIGLTPDALVNLPSELIAGRPFMP